MRVGLIGMMAALSAIGWFPELEAALLPTSAMSKLARGTGIEFHELSSPGPDDKKSNKSLDQLRRKHAAYALRFGGCDIYQVTQDLNIGEFQKTIPTMIKEVGLGSTDRNMVLDNVAAVKMEDGQ